MLALQSRTERMKPNGRQEKPLRANRHSAPYACAAGAGTICRTLSEFVEQLITDYYKMKEGTKMTGDMRTMAIQLPEELFERLKAYLKKNNLKQKQFIIRLIEDALEQDEEDTTAQAGSENASETEEPDEPDMDAEEE